jgi:nucleoside-diphosphate-sugar epimerase
MMRILITGNMGYVGPMLVAHLRQVFPSAELVGFDTGYFAHCLTGAEVLPETVCDVQRFGDVRKFDPALLDGMDAVVMLAAISNDPMGKQYEGVTDAINHLVCAEIAREAVARGVKRVVFASSCSMYGFAAGAARKETDELNPLTAYARSKVATEQALVQLDPRDAVITSLRFSTACGMSPRLRLDLVLNDFVASAIAAREITVLSDGTPWRPLIDVRDMARAIEWALIRDPAQAGQYVAVNVGTEEWNYQVKELAAAVAEAIPGTTVSINTNAPPDKRSYRVDFSLYKQIAPNHQPQVTLHESVALLKDGLERMAFQNADFRTSTYMRLKVLEKHREEGRLDADLYWSRG